MKEQTVITEKWASKWIFTHNAKTFTDLIASFQLSKIPAKVLSFKESFEVGEKGNLHKHVFVALNRSVRKSTLIKKFPLTDIRPITPGTEQTVITYIGNTDKEVSKGCHIISVSEWGNLDTGQGARTDLSETDSKLWQVKDAIDNGADKRTLYNDFFPYMVRYGVGITAYFDYCREEGERKVILSAEEQQLENLAEERILMERIAAEQIKNDNANYRCEKCNRHLKWNIENRAYACEIHGVSELSY